MRTRVAITLALAVLAAAPAAGAARLRLLHDTFNSLYRSPFGAVPTGTKVTLRLRATGAKVRAVTLVAVRTDPATSASSPSSVRMRRRGSLWSATLPAPAKPAIVLYTFRVRTARGVVWYGDDYGGEGDDVHEGGTGHTSTLQPAGFRLTVYDRAFTTPSWLRGAVAYSIFADRFRNGDPTNDYCRAGSTTGCPIFYGNVPAAAHATWNEPIEDSHATGVFNRDFFGGDLAGVTGKLDYLKSLGVDAIWLTPIFTARSNHRYDTDDYMHVDPALGGDAAFAALAAAAHARGIHLILDGVFNHTSSDSLYFDRYHRYPTVGACEAPSSPYRSWYLISGNAVPCETYATFGGFDTLPQLDHAAQQVREFIYRGPASVVCHWDNAGADGWRLDAAQEIAHDWWRDFRSSVKSYAPDGPLVGEITAGPADATPYLLGNELDGVMNYRFRVAANGFARATNYSDANGDIPALTPSRLDHALRVVLQDYPLQAMQSSFDLVDSHDTNRLLFVLTEPGDSLAVAKERQRLAALLQFTWVGAPMIYYGDEAGINAPGKNSLGDPYNRAPYPWTDESGNVGTYGPPDQAMIDYYARLARIRRELPALRGGVVKTLLTGDTTRSKGDNGVYAFLRSGDAAKPVVVVLNKGVSGVTMSVPLQGAYRSGTVLEDAIGDGKFTVSGRAVSLTVPARGGLVLSG